MDINSSKNAVEFIDLTVLNTPKPQASSTVEKRGIHSYRTETILNNCNLQNVKSKNMDVPTRDVDTQSNHSSVSSLGILSMDNIDDIEHFKEYLVSKKEDDIQRKSNINENLAMQRLLAQRAMERADFNSKAKGNGVGGLPSYLLKPTKSGVNNTIHTATPTKNESTINLSDLERSLPPKLSTESNKISFEAKEISARSSSFGNQSKKLSVESSSFTNLSMRSPSPVRGFSSDSATKYQNICEKLRQSDASLTALCDRSNRLGMNTQPLGSLPLPEMETIDLTSTRASWINSEQDSLIAKLQNELFTPAELAEDKLLSDELSWRKAKDIPSEFYHNDKTDFSDSIGENDMSRLNDKISMSEFFLQRSDDINDLHFKTSPEKQHEPVPLINISSDTTSHDDSVQFVSESKDKNLSTSMLSISNIANILSKMDLHDSPSYALNLILKKSTSNTNTPCSETSTLKNSKIITSPLSGGDSTLKENSQTDRLNFKSPNNFKSPKRSNSEAVLRDTTNLRSVSSDGEWTDAKSYVAGLSDNNGTVSTIAESPSYSCSELEFSDSDRSSSAGSGHSDEWLQVDKFQPQKLYVDVSENIPITLISKTNNWLHIKVFLKEIFSNCSAENVAKIKILNKAGILKPHATEEFFVKITSLIAGKFKVLIKIEVTNLDTKKQQFLEHVIIVEAEEPKLNFLSDTLDFKLNPEGSIKSLMLPIVNEYNFDFQISLTILQEHEVFRFGSDSESDIDEDNRVETNRLITIPACEKVSIAIEMRGLALEYLGAGPGEDSIVVIGNLQVLLADTSKILRQIHLTGSVGFTKVQFRSCIPFELTPGQTKPMQVRNSGVVPLELSVRVALPDSDVAIEDNDFTIDTKSLMLKPGQIGTIGVTFNSKERLRPMKRVIRLDYPRGPSFALPIEGILDTRSPDIKQTTTPPPMRSGSSGSSGLSSAGSIHSLPDGKLPIESTKTELVWGCIRPGRNSSQEFLLRNRCSQRVRLQAVIKGSSAFKFVKEQNENTTSINLVLHALESRSISVIFCPNGTGAACARVMFLPMEQDASYYKRQMIQLYGYGGYVAVDVQKVAKDTSGRMWLSFGRLDYRDSLHQNFILRNTGSLTAFACLSVTCKVLYPFMDSSVTIYPTEAIIEPNKEIEISVSFSPRPEDFKYVQKSGGVEVSEIASIKVMTGPEPTRGRIRRLFNKLSSNNSPITSQLTTAFIVPRLSSPFPSEHLPPDLSSCREGTSSLRDLLRDVDSRDLILTIERTSTDCTQHALDDSLMFQSLVIADTTSMNATGTTGGGFCTMNVVSGRMSGGFCSVEPKNLVLGMNEDGMVMIKSHHSRPMPFEVFVCGVEAGVQVSPNVGVLKPGESQKLKVKCRKVPNRLPHTCAVMIYVENEVMEIELKIQKNTHRD